MAIVLFKLSNIIGDYASGGCSAGPRFVRACSATDYYYYMSLPMYTINDHTYPELDSQSSKFLIPNFDDFSGRCCLKERRPFHNLRDSSREMFCEGKYKA
jgi:hypothetical protein